MVKSRQCLSRPVPVPLQSSEWLLLVMVGYSHSRLPVGHEPVFRSFISFMLNME